MQIIFMKRIKVQWNLDWIYKLNKHYKTLNLADNKLQHCTLLWTQLLKKSVNQYRNNREKEQVFQEV